MKAVIVLAMHGTPPSDFPRDALLEFFDLHSRLEHSHGPVDASLQQRYRELEGKIRHWPRTTKNDPFYFASLDLAAKLNERIGHEVVLGFNEFCAPDIEDALEKAVGKGADKIVVVTPMMTKGGEHAESDIPKAIQRVQKRYPQVPMFYAWPFEDGVVTEFLAVQIERFL
jgi:sirohydrochlorin cobaltochelatase